MTSGPLPPTDPREVQRVRHPLKARLVQVLRVRDLTPALRCITFGGDSLRDFVSASFDDHVKLMLPTPGVPFELPPMPPPPPADAEGAPPPPPSSPPPAGPRPTMRDYTPRRIDTAAGELDIEFAMHGSGPADDFARAAQPGQQAGIAGPRGSFVVPQAFDWHLLIGDDSALPAIARRLEELPAAARVIVVAEVQDEACRPALRAPQDTRFVWLSRADAARTLAEATAALTLPPGDGFAWAAGESAQIAAVRRELIGRHGLDKRRVRASAYWKRGDVAHHGKFED